MIAKLWHWISSLFHKAPAVTLTHGVYVFCGWANPRTEFGQVPGIQCPTATPWDMKTADRVPSFGQYDERLATVTQWRARWMLEAKIDYACYQVEWRHDTHELLWSQCADNHPPRSPVKFCMSFFNVLANTVDRTYYQDLTPDQIDASTKAFAAAIENYTLQPNYLRIDGRPVIFLGYIVAPRFIAVLREAIPNAYLVATAIAPELFAGLKARGFDAYTEYLLYSVEGWGGVMNAYHGRWEQAIDICKSTGIDYWVPACAGFNGAAWGINNPPFMPTPAQFTAHLKEARRFARDNAKYTRGQVITYAWNEFAEGGILEPMAPGMLHSGDEMLRAHAAAIV